MWYNMSGREVILFWGVDGVVLGVVRHGFVNMTL